MSEQKYTLVELALPSDLVTSDVEAFIKEVKKIVALYAAKNKDYGNAFLNSFIKFGPMYPLSRLDDKLNRLVTILKNGDIFVKEESVKDTLMDIAAYAIMSLVAFNKQNDTV